MFFLSDAARRSSLPRVALGVVVAVVGAGPGCFPTDNGPEPPQQQLYFPTALVPSPAGHALFVINSDFDLQYKAGTVQVLDLDRVRSMIPELGRVGQSSAGTGGSAVFSTADACAAKQLGVQPTEAAILYPGACTAIDINAPPDNQGTLVKNSVSIGAFGSDAVMSVHPDAARCCPQGTAAGVRCPCIGGQPARLLIPVRGDPSLTWLEVDDDREDFTGSLGRQRFSLECSQASASGHCADDHKAGIDASENTRSLTMPSEPFSIAIGDATEDITAVVVSHQTTGTASLFTNDWNTRPSLTFVLAGLPTGVTGALAFPKPQLAIEHPEYPYEPGFLLSFRTAAEVDVVRYYDDKAASPSRPFLSRTARIGITTNAAGFDSRSIALDTRGRRLAEAACNDKTGDDRQSCLASAAGTPVAAFAANRIPPTLLVGQTTTNASSYGTDDSVYFYDSVPLSQGPSHVYVGEVWDGTAGVKRTRVFVLCFDARTLYVYDPDARAMEAVIQTGRGPSAMTFDPLVGRRPGTGEVLAAGAATWPNGNYAYLAHFTDSYLGVIDLDMSHPSYLTIVGSVGVPAPPRESK